MSSPFFVIWELEDTKHVKNISCPDWNLIDFEQYHKVLVWQSASIDQIIPTHGICIHRNLILDDVEYNRAQGNYPTDDIKCPRLELQGEIESNLQMHTLLATFNCWIEKKTVIPTFSGVLISLISVVSGSGPTPVKLAVCLKLTSPVWRRVPLGASLTKKANGPEEINLGTLCS